METYWHHTRLPGRVKMSSRQVFLPGNDDTRENILVEEIVLESLDNLQIKDEGQEHEYPNLRRRK